MADGESGQSMTASAGSSTDSHDFGGDPTFVGYRPHPGWLDYASVDPAVIRPGAAEAIPATDHQDGFTMSR